MAKQTISLSYLKSVQVIQNLPNYSSVSSDAYYLMGSAADANQRRLILAFQAFPTALAHQRLYSAYVQGYVKTLRGTLNAVSIREAPEAFTDFDPTTVTWNTLAQFDVWKVVGAASFSGSGEYERIAIPSQDPELDYKSFAAAMVSRPVALASSDGFYFGISNQPVLVVEYDDTITVPSQIYADNNTSGYLNPHESQVFRWHYEDNDPDGYQAAGPIEQEAAVFYWRLGTSGAWNQIPVNSNQQSITIPAETFSGGSLINWKVQGTDSVGQTSETPVFILNIDDSSRISQPVAPVSVIVSDAEPVNFEWTSANSHGTPQTAADLQYSLAGGEWVDLAHIDGAATAYSAPADTFEAGNYLWRVRTYNVDGDAGEWSSTAAFIFMAAPVVQALYATPVPFSTVSWQAANQQAYKVSIDGIEIGTFFGDAKSYTVTRFLADGLHTVTVSAQNIFSIWSEPASYSFYVENAEGQAVTLSGEFGIDATLAWVSESEVPGFQIYRDDKLIGGTSGNFFTDRFVLGQHSYYVINVLPGGYYTKSNVVTGAMKACTTVIDTLQNPSGWMELRLTANDPDEQIFSYQRTASLRHFTGSVYPVLELAKYEDGSGTYDVAFPDLQSAQAFEALKGQVVIIKSRGGNVVIGALLQLQKRVGDFFIAFDFTVQRIAWEDFVDDQNG